MQETILIVDTDPSHLQMTELAVQKKLHFRVIGTRSSEDAMQMVMSENSPAILLLDMVMPGGGGLEVVRAVRACRPNVPIIVFTAHGQDEEAMRAIQAGATDFLTKPVTVERLRLSIHNALRLHRLGAYVSRLEAQSRAHVQFSDIVGRCEAMQLALDKAKQAAASAVPVWIVGECGTGKELFARAIHGNGSRAGRPFVMLDCAGFEGDSGLAQEIMLQKLREAQRGTLFLRDIHALPPSLQVVLLQMLNASADMDVRLICSEIQAPGGGTDAARRKLDAKLLQRLQGVSITLPPLRERGRDLALLAQHFVRMHAASERKNISGITDWAIELLSAGHWPSNVRQLSHLLWRAVLLCHNEMLDAGDIRLLQQQSNIYENRPSQSARAASPLLLDVDGRVKKLKHLEEEAIRFALHYSGGCMTRAARNLGIGRSTLYRRVSELGMDEGHISRANHTTRPTMMASAIERS